MVDCFPRHLVRCLGLSIEGQGGSTFDPFPFSLFTMIVSLESIFLSLFILMSQDRTGIQADYRNHLDLQINLLTEDQNTKMLQMLQALCEHHKLGIANDPAIKAMEENRNRGSHDAIEGEPPGWRIIHLALAGGGVRVSKRELAG